MCFDEAGCQRERCLGKSFFRDKKAKKIVLDKNYFLQN